MDRAQLKQSIRAKIDEVSTANEILVDVSFGEGKTLDILIEELLNECANELLMITPVHRLTITKAVNPTNTGKTAYSGKVALPSDFLRFISLKATTMLRPITELVPEISPVAKRQSNEYMRGTIERPVGVLETNENGNIIHYYGVSSDAHAIEGLMYIKQTLPESLPVLLQNPLCWLCASKVLAVMGDTNGAKIAAEYYTNGIL